MLITDYKIFELYKESDFDRAIEIVISHISNSANVKFGGYGEELKVKRNGEELMGVLFIAITMNRAIRFNYKSKDKTRNIISVDLFENFDLYPDEGFMSNPTKTLDLGGESIVSHLDNIVTFFKSGRINEVLSVGASAAEEATTSNYSDYKDELDIDVFDLVRAFTTQVAEGTSNAFILSGTPGVGKTYEVEQILKKIRPDFVEFGGQGSASGLYEALFHNHDKLVLLDDIDALLTNSSVQDILKKVLDTKPVRNVSYVAKGYFNSAGMTMDEIQEEYKKRGKKSLPNQFEFTGQIIFITNKTSDQLDSAVLNRSLHIDIALTREEIIKRLGKIMAHLEPKGEMKIKMEAFAYLIWLTANFKTKENLSIRSLIHTINIRLQNNYNIKSGNKSLKMWKVLAKKTLVV